MWSETLLEPLTSDEEEAMLERYYNGDEEAERLLIEHNLRLVVHVAKKFKNQIEEEDLLSIGSMGLIKAIKGFKADMKLKLSTYATKCITNEIMMHIRKTANEQEISLDTVLFHNLGSGDSLNLSDVIGTEKDITSYEIEKETERKVLMDSITRLKEKEQVIICSLFGLSGGEPMSQKEVAEKYGMTPANVSKMKKNAIKKMKRNMRNCS